jgi:parallel beta-helix repeat protein
MLRFHRLMIVAVVGLFSTVHADTIYVDDDNCPGPGTGSVVDPYCSIQTAIDNAVDTDEIVVAPGTYFETIDFLGKAVTLRSAVGPEVTIIDAQEMGKVVTCVSGEGPDTVLEGFTVMGGSFTNGGGMFNRGSSPTVTNCTFSGNSAHGLGGGMYNNDSNPTVTNCTFSENQAIYCIDTPGICWGSGGGMSNYLSSPTVTDCTFTDNYAGQEGGGMYNESSSPTVTNCTFTDNYAGSYWLCCGPQGSGGGMSNLDSSPTVMGCTFSGNSTVRASGGMFSSGGSPTVIGCTFSGNDAGSCFRCWGAGGGMFNSGSNPTVIGCTFSSNSADSGGALAFEWGASDLVMTNCVLWDGGDEIWNNNGSSVTINYTDVQGGFPGDGNIDADPLLVRDPDPGPDGYWGTADDDYGDLRLQPGSPCIDAGDNTAVPAGIDTDLDGNPRFIDDPNTVDTGYGGPPIVDMGAYEFQIPCPWDLNGDGLVNVVDLLIVIGSWGPCVDCPADFDDDGLVNVVDLLALIANFGPCPGAPCVWDVTGDGVVDQSDLQQVLDNMGPCDGCPEDVNGDGFVNGQDAAAVATHFGPCP